MVPDEIGLSAFQEATPNGTPDVTQLSGSAAAGSMEEAIARNRMRQADLKAQYEAWKTLEVRRLEDDPNLPAGSFIVPTYREWLDQGLALPTKFRSPQERV